MKRKTTITLTMAGLLAMAGMLYAATAIPFHVFGPPNSREGDPVGVAAAPADLFVSEFCTPLDQFFTQIDRLDCSGTPSVYATIPTASQNACNERYLALVPLSALNATPPWTPRDLFVTAGNDVFKVRPGTVTPFTSIPGCSTDHTGITFDHVGNFGYNMILTCDNGGVWEVDRDGNAMHLADTGTGLEGPAVVPQAFGPHGGEIWAADEIDGGIVTIGYDMNHTVTHSVVNLVGAEAVNVVPTTLCTFCSGGAAFLAVTNLNTVYEYMPIDFQNFLGDVIITSENGAGSVVVTTDGTNYNTQFFDNIPFAAYEGSSFVDCDVPTPTPTTTPTATATATATATPTPTPTAIPTTCGSSFVIGDLDAVVGHKVTFWGAQWWRLNHLSGGIAPASFKGFANCTDPNPPACGGTWQSDPGNSSGPPPSVPADITVIVSSLITKSGQLISGDVPMMVTVHTDPGYQPDPGHAGTGTVTAVICGSGHAPRQIHRDPVHR